MSNDNGTSAIQRRGLMLVLSSPSGAGKTTLSRQLLDNDKQIQLSVSCTTRQKRPGERDGVDYRFVDTATFRGMIERKEFLEYAEVFANYYGTPKAPVDEALAAGRDVLFDIDWQGTQQLRDKGRADLVTVFILPPSTRDLEKRLLTRAQDPKDDRGPAHGQGRRRDEPLGRVRLRRGQQRHRHQPDQPQGDPDGRAAEARASGRHVGVRQRAARGAVIGCPMPVWPCERSTSCEGV